MNGLAAEFAAAIIQATQDASLAEILDIPRAPAPQRGPGRPKGSTTAVPTSVPATAVVRPVTSAPPSSGGIVDRREARTPTPSSSSCTEGGTRGRRAS